MTVSYIVLGIYILLLGCIGIIGALANWFFVRRDGSKGLVGGAGAYEGGGSRTCMSGA